MLIRNKTKKIAVAAFAALAFAPVKAKALCVSPICIFERILKATPGLPVLDFTSIPAIIPHIPAALQKEALAQLQSQLNKKEQENRSKDSPSKVPMSEMEDALQTDEMLLGENEQYASLDAFPTIASDDPIEIAKAIEVLFLRPGWEQKLDAPLSQYDQALLRYYSEQFSLNNTIEVAGFITVLKAKMLNVLASSDKIAKKLSQKDLDVNESRRLQYEARLLGYQLSIMENQLTAAKNQMYFTRQLSGMSLTLYKPVLLPGGEDGSSTVSGEETSEKEAAAEKTAEEENAEETGEEDSDEEKDFLSNAKDAAVKAGKDALKNAQDKAADVAKDAGQKAMNGDFKGAVNDVTNVAKDAAQDAASDAGRDLGKVAADEAARQGKSFVDRVTNKNNKGNSGDAGGTVGSEGSAGTEKPANEE